MIHTQRYRVCEMAINDKDVATLALLVDMIDMFGKGDKKLNFVILQTKEQSTLH